MDKSTMDKKSGAKDPVNEAVRDLRLALSDTQQQFAARLGLAISTVVRYELSRPPRGEALVPFMKLAVEHGREDLAAIFRAALSKELGYDVPLLKTMSTLEVLPGEQDDFQALASILRSNKYLKERETWRQISAPVKQAGINMDARALANMGLVSAIRKKLDQGLSVPEIAFSLSVSEEVVSALTADISTKKKPQ